MKYLHNLQKLVSWFTQKYEAPKVCSTLVIRNVSINWALKIINNNWAANQHVRMISKRSCDTEDRKNGWWKFSFAIREKIIFISHSYFLLALVLYLSMRYFFQKHKKNKNRKTLIILDFWSLVCYISHISYLYYKLYYLTIQLYSKFKLRDSEKVIFFMITTMEYVLIQRLEGY